MVIVVFPRHAAAGPPIQGCSIGITKEAFPPVDRSFDFVATFSVDPVEEFSLPAGSATNVFLTPGESVVVSEIVPEGWELIDVRCDEPGPGLFVFVDDENKVTATCQSLGFVSCTFTNRGPANVPALSEWGMIAAAAGLGMIGVFFAVRRLRASKQSDAIG